MLGNPIPWFCFVRGVGDGGIATKITFIVFGSLVAQSCPTLCDPKDLGPPGSSVQGILQARILEWVAIPNPGIKPRSPALQADSLTGSLSEPLEKSLGYKDFTFRRSASCLSGT